MAKSVFLVPFAAFIFFADTSYAEPNLPGPYPATVISVVDGDTVKVNVKIWLGLSQEVKVRIAEIDAPEISSKCTKEKELGQKAKAFLESVLTKQSTINLTKISEDKFGGRVDAAIQTKDGKDVGELLRSEGLASPYNRRGKKKNWCDPESPKEQVSQSKPRRDVEVDSQ
jgi:micrococcal nuclease